MLSSGRLEPRKVVGSVDTAEFLVTLGASIGFLIGFSFSGVKFAWVAVLLVSGVVAAPLAALIVRRLTARILGTAAGALIVLTNTKTIADQLSLPNAAVAASYLGVILLGVIAITTAVRKVKYETKQLHSAAH